MRFTIEGLNGSGKSTFIATVKLLLDSMDAYRRPFYQFKFPDYNTHDSKVFINSILYNGADYGTNLEAYLFAINKQTLATEIKRLENDGNCDIFVDRGTLSNIAVKGAKHRLKDNDEYATDDFIERIYNWELSILPPEDVIVFLDTSPEICQKRLAERSGCDLEDSNVLHQKMTYSYYQRELNNIQAGLTPHKELGKIPTIVRLSLPEKAEGNDYLDSVQEFINTYVPMNLTETHFVKHNDATSVVRLYERLGLTQLPFSLYQFLNFVVDAVAGKELVFGGSNTKVICKGVSTIGKIFEVHRNV